MIRLAEIRKEKGYSQARLSAKSGVNQQTISMIEKGERKNPGILTMSAIAKALECSLDALIAPSETAPTENDTEASLCGLPIDQKRLQADCLEALVHPEEHVGVHANVITANQGR